MRLVCNDVTWAKGTTTVATDFGNPVNEVERVISSWQSLPLARDAVGRTGDQTACAFMRS
jgi:hypothetical protein